MSRDARTRSSAHSPAFTSTTTTSTQNETTGKTIAGVGGRAQRQLVLPVRLGISASHHRLTVSPGNCGQPVEHLVSSMSSCRMCLKRLRDANAASAKSAEWFTATCHAQAPCAQDQILSECPPLRAFTDHNKPIESLLFTFCEVRDCTLHFRLKWCPCGLPLSA